MVLQKEMVGDIEVIHSPKDIQYKNFLILIPGGGKTIGASRFDMLQHKLLEHNIGSISISFAGVEGSVGTVSEDSLKNRIDTTLTIAKWVEENFAYDQLSLYGVSMGGYIALGVQRVLECNGKIILHTPAAYAQDAHDVQFTDQFTSILRTEQSWKDSYSFDWLQDIKNQVLLIIHSQDEIIPIEISNRYKNIVFKNTNSKVIEIEGAQHSIWTSDDNNSVYKAQIVSEIINLINIVSL
jgi:alpha/beta superfamily hydrolase